MAKGYFDGFMGSVHSFALVATAIGAGFAGYAAYDGYEARRILANGVETTAIVDQMTEVTGRRRATTYTIDVSWIDQSGTPRKDVLDITNEFARQNLDGNQVLLTDVTLKYLPNEPSAKPIVVENSALQLSQDANNLQLGGIGAGLAGLLSLLLFVFRRKAKTEDAPEAEQA